MRKPDGAEPTPPSTGPETQSFYHAVCGAHGVKGCRVCWPSNAAAPVSGEGTHGQQYSCRQCHDAFSNVRFTISVPGIPAKTYLFCSSDCREAWLRGDDVDGRVRAANREHPRPEGDVTETDAPSATAGEGTGTPPLDIDIFCADVLKQMREDGDLLTSEEVAEIMEVLLIRARTPQPNAELVRIARGCVGGHRFQAVLEADRRETDCCLCGHLTWAEWTKRQTRVEPKRAGAVVLGITEEELAAPVSLSQGEGTGTLTLRRYTSRNGVVAYDHKVGDTPRTEDVYLAADVDHELIDIGNARLKRVLAYEAECEDWRQRLEVERRLRQAAEAESVAKDAQLAEAQIAKTHVAFFEDQHRKSQAIIAAVGKIFGAEEGDSPSLTRMFLPEQARHLVEKLDGLRSTLADLRRQGEWQPIATCPREADTEYIFWCEPKTDDEIRASNGGILVPCPPSARLFIGGYGDWQFQQKATHWRPLPDPPKERL